MVVKNATIRDAAVEAGRLGGDSFESDEPQSSRVPRITAFMTKREMVEAAIYGAVHDVGPNIPNDISVIGLASPVREPNLTFRASSGPVRRNRTKKSKPHNERI